MNFDQDKIEYDEEGSELVMQVWSAHKDMFENNPND